MKKIVILALGFFLFCSMAFAYDLSAGVGFAYGLINDKWENYYSDIDPFSPSRNQFGGFAFFGTRYTEFNFSVRYSLNKWEDEDGDKNTDSALMLSVGAYFKYPFTLSSAIVLFPTIGIDFDGVENFSYLWFRGGIGLDVYFTERVFLRIQGLYGYGIAPPFIMNDLKYDDGSKIVVTPGHGPVARLGIGWMF